MGMCLTHIPMKFPMDRGYFTGRDPTCCGLGRESFFPLNLVGLIRPGQKVFEISRVGSQGFKLF